MSKEKICVALDVDSLEQATQIAKEIKDYVGIFKIGSQLYSSEGHEVVKAIKKIKGKIFLDLKYHDIPNTVANAARIITRMGISMFNIHTSGGYEMMARTVEAVNDESERLKINKPIILGVTVLTSINDLILKNDLKINLSVPDYVLNLAKLAKRAGLDGVVASPKETTLIRKVLGEKFIILTPGIRPLWATAPNDQKRVTIPAEAIENGSDYIVIGRPIIKADNPLEAVKKVLAEIQ